MGCLSMIAEKKRQCEVLLANLRAHEHYCAEHNVCFSETWSSCIVTAAAFSGGRLRQKYRQLSRGLSNRNERFRHTQECLSADHAVGEKGLHLR
jgi:hypothetical protein